MVRILAAIYFVTLAGVFMLQDKLLYFPQRASIKEMLEPGLAAWPAAGEFRGLIAEPPATIAVRGTAIVFHGNAGLANHRRYYADVLTAQGLRVILAEYPGYGPRVGTPTEERLVVDAADSIALAQRTYGEPLLVIGESLGAGVAAAATVKLPNRSFGLMLITPWDTLGNVASHHYPWLPVRWIVGDAYNSVTNLLQFTQPLMVVIAERDSIVPAQFGIALYESGQGLRRLVTIKHAEHNDWADQVDAAWWHNALAFLLPPKQ
ncbi:MAG: alpha/beta hydrolase [Rhodocyclaceae bacterium]|nr:alpha/beta hydrolase [Rhodocyclaceae bacterium]